MSENTPYSRGQIITGLQQLIHEMDFVRYGEDFDGDFDGGIWTSGETDWIFKGLPPFDHSVEYGELPLTDSGYPYPNAENFKVKDMYVDGIHREIHDWLEQRGWYSEWYDGGTLFLLKND
jgi:hypothetical protein